MHSLRKVEMERDRTVRRLALAAALAIVVWRAPHAAERRPIKETDLFSFVWVADPQIAPDGSRVAFVRVSVNQPKDQYETSIWMAGAGTPAAPPQRFTAGPRDGSPRWSPDGTSLAFVRAAEADGRVQPPPQIYVMAANGGEAHAVTDMPRGAAAPAWAPDGRTIAFSSAARPEELPGAAKPKPAGDVPGRESDVRVITDAAYRANGVPGSGYVDADRPAQIWIVPVSGGAPVPPTR